MLRETIYLNDYMIDIYINNLESKTSLPLVILNSYKNEKINEVIDLIREGSSFILIDIKLEDWSKVLSPYKTQMNDNFFKNLNGEGKSHLDFIDNTLIPYLITHLKSNFKLDVSNSLLAGYSLGGLFAIYGGLNSKYISKIVSVSGSLWYPHFLDYVTSLNINRNIKSIYISLGNKEKKTRNRYMKKIEKATLNIYSYLKTKYSNVFFEFNEGNHFFHSNKRLAKGIVYELTLNENKDRI